MPSVKEEVEREVRAITRERELEDKRKYIPKGLAIEIMENWTFITMRDNQDVYVYLDGYYQPFGEVIIREECKAALEEDYRRNKVGEVIDFIKASTYADRREEPPNLIPLENGVLNLDTMELKPHSPEYMFFNKIPVKYNPQAKCPSIDKFLREITNGEDDVALLEEWTGYCLFREYFIAKALMLVGEGANGKSTFLSLLKSFLGAKNVSGRSLQELEENRFAKADLHTKLANIHADLPDQALQRTGMFKMLTGRDWITAERKFQNSFNYVNYAKLTYSANMVPGVFDDTGAFFRRWHIVVFPNTFEADRADPYLIHKLTTEEELSGLLNRALEKLKKIRMTGSFSNSKTTDEIKEDYIRKSSPIASFVMDEIEVDSEGWIVKKELYSAFARYCREFKLPCVGYDTFCKNLPKHIAVAEFRPMDGERARAFKGIRFKEEKPDVQPVHPVQPLSYFNKTEERHESSLIKMGERVDEVDVVDAKPEDNTFLKPLGEDEAETQRLEDLNDYLLVEGIIRRHGSIGVFKIKEIMESRRGKTFHIDYVREILTFLRDKGRIEFDGTVATWRGEKR
jgi:putative DNA primase/helicase